MLMKARNESSQIEWVLAGTLFLVTGLPFLIGYGVMPLTNFGAEVVAVVGLGVLWLSTLVFAQAHTYVVGRSVRVAIAVPVGLAAWVLIKTVVIHPARVNWPNLVVYEGYLLGAAGAVWVGFVLSTALPREKLERMIVGSLLVAGGLAAVGSYLQYFQIDAYWLTLSPSSDAGRTYGFIRQANHQATFLCMGIASLLYWRSRQASTAWYWYGGVAFLAWAVLTTGSRAGIVQMVMLLLLFGWLGAHVRARARVHLLGAAAIFILGWGLLYAADRWLNISFYGAEKLVQSQTEGVGLRRELWLGSWGLILDQPWWGHPVQSFRSAFLLAGHVLETRVAMESAHNFFLQAAFEWGVPVAVTLHLALLKWAVLVKKAMVRRPIVLLVVALIACVLVHSQFEYPLWYSYFLFPAALFFGVSLGQVPEVGSAEVVGRSSGGSRRSKLKALSLMVAPIALVWAGLSANRDFYRQTPIFLNQNPESLEQSFAEAKSVFWFQQYVRLPEYIRDGKENPAPTPKRLKSLAFLGCSLPEPWYQPASLFALAEAGYGKDAQWISYMLIELNPKNQAVIETMLNAQRGPWVDEFKAYVSEPKSVLPSAEFFRRTCSG
jgi:hypothetical protein